jgi:hypothetical protein
MDQALADVEPKKFPQKDHPKFTPIDDEALAISSTGYNAVDSAYTAYSYDYTYSNQSGSFSRSATSDEDGDEDEEVDESEDSEDAEDGGDEGDYE